jgi:hypothetical protein
MINFKRLCICLAAVIFPLIFVQTTFACQRTPGEVPFCYIFQSAQAVFVGEVIKSEPHNIVPDNPNLSPEKKAAWTYKYDRLTFAATEIFKGAAKSEFETLNLAEIVTSCDTVTKIKIGQKWVVFAYQRDGKDEFYVSSASFFYDGANEAEKLGYLRAAVNKETKTGLYGQFAANYPASLIKIEGYKVIAEGNGRRLTAKMDKYGQYAFPAISGGIYKIKIQIPFDSYLQEGNHRTNFVFDHKTGLYTYEYETTVKENECAYKQIRAYPVALNNSEDK